MRRVVPEELAAVLALLPAPVTEASRLGGGRAGRPWRVRYAGRDVVLRGSDLGRLAALGFTEDQARASTEWLHVLLRDLREAGFVAPAPIDDLLGRSIATVDGAMWELLSFVPGRPVEWLDLAGLGRAGELLARLHVASLSLPSREQRPGALPFDRCRPAHPDAVFARARIAIELADIGYDSAPRAVVHGDATNANIVADGHQLRLVDFALAYREPLLADLGSALWQNGRRGWDFMDYDPARVAAFVAGYAGVRPLSAPEGREIAVYMKCRGLQIQHRLERRGGHDDSVMARLRSVVARQADIERAVETALDRPRSRASAS